MTAATRLARSYERAEQHSRSVNMARDYATSDPVYGRAAVPLSYKTWGRFHPTEQPVHVTDAWGRDRVLTPTQYRVYQATQQLIAAHSERVTMTAIANSLGVSVSTVGRALIRLVSFGLVSYDVKRGRSGGVALYVIQSATLLKDRAQAAWDRLTDAATRARARALARSMESLERSGYPMETMLRSIRGMVATFSWTAADMAEVDAMVGL